MESNKYSPESHFEVQALHDGTSVMITGYKGNRKEVHIPPEINQRRVAYIGREAFSEKNLTSVIIPDSVIEIELRAFSWNQLTSVIIPDSVSSIGDSAFIHNQLASVTIGAGVTSIGESAFEKNKLTSVIIPDKVTSIGKSAFSNNELTSVNIPDSVSSIGDWAFSGNRLTTVNIPASATIGESAFDKNGGLAAINVSPGNPNYVSVDGVLYNKDSTVLLKWPPGKPGRITIPPSVTAIGDNAFEGNELTSFTIPDHVTEIGSQAFFSNKLTSVVIPGSITRIGSMAFASNKLTSVTIPGSVTKIGSQAFWLNKLTELIISDGVTSIGTMAFGGNQLLDITIPDSVTEIEANAFDKNYLTGVTIPAAVTMIGEGAFVRNPWLEAINVSPDNQNYSSIDGALYDKEGTELLQWPEGKSDKVTIPLSVIHIRSSAFGEIRPTGITIGANVQLWNCFNYSNGFEEFYKAQGKKAGTYTRKTPTSDKWTRKEKNA